MSEFVIKHQDMVLEYGDLGGCTVQQSLNIDSKFECLRPPYGYPNFVLAVAGKPFGRFNNHNVGYAFMPLDMELISHSQQGTAEVLTYLHRQMQLSVEVVFEKIQGCNMLRQTNTVKNLGQEPVGIRHFSSAFVSGLAADGNLDWQDRNKIKLHYCQNTWEGEGQWRSTDLESAGIYRTSNGPCNNAFHLSSVGSWSTGTYVPVLMLEDQETGRIWYLQLETSASWHLSVGYRSDWGRTDGSLFMQADAADERRTHFYLELAPGESFTAESCAFGCCQGSVNEAIRELTRYRRTRKPAPAWNGEAPLFFNDYMNCLWADPTAQKLIPLIDSAAQAGAEGFCIDSGWFAAKDHLWSACMGDWNAFEGRFSPMGFQGIIDYIRQKGMRPGVWLEMEVCGETSEICRQNDSWFLMRHGKRIGGGERYFFNFTNPDVCTYIKSKIDALYQMGIRFIKNDYNDCSGVGDDSVSSNYQVSLLRNLAAFYKMIDEIRAEHPDLIIENCGSGAMRQDYSALSHFHLQSTSDQEIHTKYPSIIIGSSVNLLPEQAGIWSYPIPLLLQDKKDEKILDCAEYHALMADGEQTIFNMVNGMCGTMYLSGRIDRADEKNRALIREGCALYKKNRGFIHRGYAFLPTGFLRFNADSAGGFGIISEDGSAMQVAVWRINQSDPDVTLKLPGCKGCGVTIEQIYPVGDEYQTAVNYDQAQGAMTVEMKKKNSARLFWVSKY